MNEEKKSHIPGIYNYCNRWCEKCGFTSKCLLFTNESKITTHQILNDGELPGVKNIFDFPEELDEDDDSQFDEFDDEGFEFDPDEEDDDPFLNDLPDFEEVKFIEDREQRAVGLNDNVLLKLADEYFKNSHSLIKKIYEKYKFESFKKEDQNGKFIIRLHENFEIVEWYHIFIMVKVRRALSGKRNFDKENDEDIKEIEAYDMNGTAKIAVIAIEDSIKALNKLFDDAVEFKNEITGLLITAGKLLNEMGKEIPDCKNFMRPGLDE